MRLLVERLSNGKFYASVEYRGFISGAYARTRSEAIFEAFAHFPKRLVTA